MNYSQKSTTSVTRFTEGQDTLLQGDCNKQNRIPDLRGLIKIIDIGREEGYPRKVF